MAFDDKSKIEIMKSVSLIGAGKLGLCFALNLDANGYDVTAVDLNEKYVDSVNNRSFNSDEQGVNEMLKDSKLKLTTSVDEALKNDLIFVLVATPSLPNGEYDHSQIERATDEILKFGKQEDKKHLVICCTTMPGYCDSLQEKVKDFNYTVSYNPEFIAQGTILRDQVKPDMILIGEADAVAGDLIERVYMDFVQNSPRVCRMTRTEAEITKIALNCFLTTKIAYANTVGDVSIASGCNPNVILEAIGSDSRIGNKYLRYGFGFGGPCFPRDNRAFGIFSKSEGVEPYISRATDLANDDHIHQQIKHWQKTRVESFTGSTDYFSTSRVDEVFPKIIIESVSYKPESTMITESQQLKLAINLRKKGFDILIRERESVVEQLKKEFGDFFQYETR
jgi:UDPglucose 6-dehydrogenase